MVYCIPVNPYPLTKYKGIETMFVMIQNIQFSIFLFAINHIATNAAAVVNVSK